MIRAIEDVERDVIGVLHGPMGIHDIVCAVPDEKPYRVKLAALNMLSRGALALDEQCRFVRHAA